MEPIIIFGASGKTGLVTVQEAMKQGYEVTAFVRDPAKLGEVEPHHVEVGDVLDAKRVSEAVQGKKGVIVVLGNRENLGPTTVLSDGLKNILQAMVEHGVKRITCCISSFLFWERAKVPAIYQPITEDHERMLNLLKSCDREWIAILPPHIADAPARGDYTLKNDGPVGRVIHKPDLAAILVSCLKKDEHVGHAMGMGYPQ